VETLPAAWPLLHSVTACRQQPGGASILAAMQHPT
jgi:hypothetical protein